MGAFGASGSGRGFGPRSGPSGRPRRDDVPRRTTRARRPLRTSDRPQHPTRALPRDGVWTPERDLDAAVLAAMGPASADRLLSLTDRRSRAGLIEHLVVAPSGVWLISPVAAKGKVEVERLPGEAPHLDIAGMDRSDVIAALAHQVAVVNAAMVEIEAAALVRGVLCLVTPKGLAGTQRTLGGALRFGDVALLAPTDLATQLQADGLLSAMDRTRVLRALAQRFPAA